MDRSRALVAAAAGPVNRFDAADFAPVNSASVRLLLPRRCSAKQAVEKSSHKLRDAMAGRTVFLAAVLAVGGATPARAADDGGFTVKLRGTAQFDVLAYDGGTLPPGQHTATGGSFRRLRLGVGGQFARNWHYEFIPKFELASSRSLPINSAYVQYDGSTPVHLRVGIYAPMENFEEATPSSDMLFLERAQPDDVARNIAGNDGRTAASLLSYDDSYFAALTFAGGLENDSAFRQKALMARFAWRPWHDENGGIAIGADVTHLLALPDYGTGRPLRFRLKEGLELQEPGADMHLVDTGSIPSDGVTEWGLESAGNYRNFYAQGGWFHYAIASAVPAAPDLLFGGWYLQSSWVLTGESKRWRTERGGYGMPQPAHPLYGGDGFGAFEVAARYSVLDLNDDAGVAAAATPVGGIRGGEQRITTLGLNWYPGGPFRFMLDYEHVDVARLSAVGGNLGADLDIVALRSQLNL